MFEENDQTVHSVEIATAATVTQVKQTIRADSKIPIDIAAIVKRCSHVLACIVHTNMIV